MELKGASCLVTGATSGIGRATALRLARRGARVLALGRDEAALAEVTARTGGASIRADLTDPGHIERAAREAGPVDVLVNNAGAGVVGTFVETDPAAVDWLVSLNLLAPVRLTRALLPGMIERGRGRVVNVASIAGHVGVPGEALYSGCKAAIIVWSEALRHELAGTGVGVTIVSPGAVDTAFFERRGLPYERKIPRLIPPDRIALVIERAIRHERAQVYEPRWMAFPARLQGTFPSLYRAMAGRFG